jgi:hypothetical protein
VVAGVYGDQQLIAAGRSQKTRGKATTGGGSSKRLPPSAAGILTQRNCKTLVRGTIQKKVTKEIVFKGYRRHASKEGPQYLIKSDKTDHLAIHKGAALKKVSKSKG